MRLAPALSTRLSLHYAGFLMPWKMSISPRLGSGAVRSAALDSIAAEHAPDRTDGVRDVMLISHVIEFKG